MIFAEPCQRAVSAGLQLARSFGAGKLEPVHLFVTICEIDDDRLTRAFASLDRNPREVAAKTRAMFKRREPLVDRQPRMSNRVVNVLVAAKRKGAAEPPDLRDVFCSLLRRADASLRLVLSNLSISTNDLLGALEGRASGTPALDQVGRDLTEAARQGQLGELVGRKNEVKQVIRTLLRKEKKNPVLVGDAGVGKTRIVEGLAALALTPSLPDALRASRIVEVSMGKLVAGMKARGDLEERLEKLVAEAEKDPAVILFIDELHTLAVAGGSGSSALNAADILKPALARGRLRCIGATTPAEFKRYIAKDAALERRFQVVRVSEPSPEEARAILEGVRQTYASHHGVAFADSALDAAVSLSVSFLPERRLPDKALDLLDQTAAAKRFVTFGQAGDVDAPTVTDSDVAATVSEWTGIPVERLSAAERERLADMEDALRRRVMGQDGAVRAVADVVRAARAGLTSRRGPQGVLMFVGPTGVGKTELAKALTEFLFGDDGRLIRLDMSELKERHAIARLLGAPPGYVGHHEGGQLTNAVRRAPHSVVLLDEVEKAHPDVFDLLLQVFDDGRLTDAQGHTTDFRHTIIIMTSNLTTGSARQRPRVGFRPTGEAVEESSADSADAEAREQLRAHFRTEFVNRIDRVVSFDRLGSQEASLIVDKVLHQLEGRLASKGITIELDEDARAAILERGFGPEEGARRLERLIERELVQPLAKLVVQGEVADGSAVRVCRSASGLSVAPTSAATVSARWSTTQPLDLAEASVVPSSRQRLGLLVASASSLATGSQHEQLDELANATLLQSPHHSLRLLRRSGMHLMAAYRSVELALHVALQLHEAIGADRSPRFLVDHAWVRGTADGSVEGDTFRDAVALSEALPSDGPAIFLTEAAHEALGEHLSVDEVRVNAEGLERIVWARRHRAARPKDA